MWWTWKPAKSSRRIGTIRHALSRRYAPIMARPIRGGFCNCTYPDSKTSFGHWYPPVNSGYQWHYQTLAIAIGTDDTGRDVEFDRNTGKLHRIYSVNDRREAILCARRLGAAKAGRKFGIPDATIRGWVSRERVRRGSPLVGAGKPGNRVSAA